MSENIKLIAIMACLKENINMPTKTIIKTILEKHFISVSERYIQKVRKAEKELAMEKGEDMFHTKNVNVLMEDWQIEVLNMGNEGGWSVQQISERLNKSDEEIRGTFTDFHYMLDSQVLDEDSETVYFEPGFGSQTVDLPLPDSDLPPDTDLNNNVISDKDFLSTPDLLDYKKREDYWSVELPECITSCSKVNEVDVFINKATRAKAMMFMKWAKAREWLAYLVGEKQEDGSYIITDMYLPDQRTSATLVDKVDADEYNKLKVVGVIHSHHEMGAGDEDRPSFSGHDTEFINSNHNVSLLAGRDRETGGFKVVGIARVTTPCGGLMKVKANVKALSEVTDEEKALKKEFFDKVFTKKNPIFLKQTTISGPSVSVGDLNNPANRSNYHFNRRPGTGEA